MFLPGPTCASCGFGAISEGGAMNAMLEADGVPGRACGACGVRPIPSLCEACGLPFSSNLGVRPGGVVRADSSGPMPPGPFTLQGNCPACGGNGVLVLQGVWRYTPDGLQHEGPLDDQYHRFVQVLMRDLQGLSSDELQQLHAEVASLRGQRLAVPSAEGEPLLSRLAKSWEPKTPGDWAAIVGQLWLLLQAATHYGPVVFSDIAQLVAVLAALRQG